MSRHHKQLTLDALNDTWDEILKKHYEQMQHIEDVRTAAVQEAARTARDEIQQIRDETTGRLEAEIKDLEEMTNSQLAELDRKHSERLKRATERIYDDMGQAIRDEAERLEHIHRHDMEQVYEDMEDGFNNMLHTVRTTADLLERRHREELERTTGQIYDDMNSGFHNVFENIRDTADRLQRMHREDLQRATSQIYDDMEAGFDEVRQNIRRETDSLRASLEQVTDQIYDDIERVTGQIYDDMEAGFDEVRENIRYVAENLERQHQEDIADVRRAMQHESDFINGRIDNVVEWTQNNMDIIDQNIRQMQQSTNARFQQQQQQISSLQENVENIFQRFQGEADIAQNITREMQQLLKVVCDHHPVAVYAPADLTSIQNQISSLLSSGYPAAAIIARADTIIQDILKMKEKAVLEKAKHDELLMKTRNRLKAILEVIAKSINQEIDKDGEKASIATDFWTDGAYSKVMSQLKEIEKLLEEEWRSKDDRMSLDAIAGLMKKAESLNLEAIALMQEAVKKSLLSHDRAVITLDMVNALIEKGYVLKEEEGEDAFDYMGGKVDGDQREGFFAILRHPITGDEVTIVLQPTPDDKTNNIDIQLTNSQQTITAQQLRESIERIRQQMNEIGYNLGQIVVPADGGNNVIPQMQSRKKLREKGATQRLRDSL